MPDQDAPIGPSLAQVPGLPTFPTWPPPSGGLPVLTPELGPITNPSPYGFGQTPNINTAPGNAWPAQKATFFPTNMPTGATGQNQSQNFLPAWRYSRMNVLPDKAPPTLSAISPPPIF
jgi:hypothetical protein